MRKVELTHTSPDGNVNMVDVGDKEISLREAMASGHIVINSDTLALVRKNGLKKGSVLSTAQIAGIMAAKRCHELIPLCHPLLLTKVDVRLREDPAGIFAESLVRSTGQTGVEMEALTAVSVALLTVYDMCKAADKNMIIENIRLVKKSKTLVKKG